MFIPGVFPLTIMKGDYFPQPIQLKDKVTGIPLDLTDSTIISEIRVDDTPGSKLIVAFTVTPTDLSIAKFLLSLTKVQTAAITQQKAGFYSVKIIDTLGQPTTYIVGPVTFSTNSTPTP